MGITQSASVPSSRNGQYQYTYGNIHPCYGNISDYLLNGSLLAKGLYGFVFAQVVELLTALQGNLFACYANGSGSIFKVFLLQCLSSVEYKF